MERSPGAAPAARYSFWWCYMRYLVLYLSFRQWHRAAITLTVSVSLLWVVYGLGWLVSLVAIACFIAGFLGYFCLHSLVTGSDKSFSDCLLAAIGVLTIVLVMGQLYVQAVWGKDPSSTLWLYSRLSLGLMGLSLAGWTVQVKWPNAWAKTLPTIRRAAITVLLGWDMVTSVWRGRKI